jgi:PPK2 family polyphosphate:nucleotide phosphotransferase
MHLAPVTKNRPPRLGGDEAAPPRNAPEGKALEEAIEKQGERLRKLQKVFYADGRFAMLIVLQGRDASGKDGVIRKVFRTMNPLGCEFTSFVAPSEEELRHDFLWRVHARVPRRRIIGVFNRSQYEDVLVVRVKKLVPKSVWSTRFEQINEFERMLTLNNVVILKFMLHVSREEQKTRLEERLTDREKHWKFNVGDLAVRASWDAYTKAYRDVLTKCSTPWAPWHIVPSDDNKVRNLLVAKTIADRLASLGLRFPKAEKGLRGTKVK